MPILGDPALRVEQAQHPRRQGFLDIHDLGNLMACLLPGRHDHREFFGKNVLLPLRFWNNFLTSCKVMPVSTTSSTINTFLPEIFLEVSNLQSGYRPRFMFLYGTVIPNFSVLQSHSMQQSLTSSGSLTVCIGWWLQTRQIHPG